MKGLLTGDFIACFRFVRNYFSFLVFLSLFRKIPLQCVSVSLNSHAILHAIFPCFRCFKCEITCVELQIDVQVQKYIRTLFWLCQMIIEIQVIGKRISQSRNMFWVGMPLKLFNISVAQGTGSRRARLLVYKQRKFYLETRYQSSLSQSGEACQPY